MLPFMTMPPPVAELLDIFGPVSPNRRPMHSQRDHQPDHSDRRRTAGGGEERSWHHCCVPGMGDRLHGCGGYRLYLNLEIQMNGRAVRTGLLRDPHTPIDPTTIRPGDIP
jgi:hypothetical protein